MAAKVKIKGGTPFDGEYEIPTSGFTGRETHYIKRVSGLRPAEYDEAMAKLDPDMMLAFASIALQRMGRQVDMELWDVDLEHCFEVVPDVEEEDADRPPAIATPGGVRSEPGAVPNGTDNATSSGENGNETGETRPPTPLLTGDLGSVTSSDSAHATSGT